MRILIAAPWLPPRGGGLERYASELAKHLARGGHDVTLLGHGESGIVDGVERVGVPARVRLSNAPLSLDVLRAARRLARDADVVNVHTPVPGTAELVAAAAHREARPFVATYHAGALASEMRLLRPAAAFHRATFERGMLARAAGLIAVSSFVAQRVFAGRASTTIMPGVDGERFSPGGRPVAGRILYVGPASRAYAWKGLATLVDALDALPDARLRVVGDGDLAAALARHPRVDVVGRVDDATLVDEYRAASVVALPSLTDAESFGMVLAEANACGRPVVGSRVGGIPCFVRDGENGLLAAPGDARDLARALRGVLEDEGLAQKLGDAGRARVLAEHRWEDVARRTALVLTAASARARGRTRP